MRVRYMELPSAVSVAPTAVVQSVQPSTQFDIAIPKPVIKPITRAARPMDIAQRARPVVGVLGRARTTGGGSGGRIGSGRGVGIGSANGPETGGLGPGFAPRSKQMLLPPDAPKSVKGLEFKVQFWIDRRGRVTKVDVVPGIEHSGYRKKFIERMLQFTFYPARGSEGTPVDGFLEVMVTP